MFKRLLFIAIALSSSISFNTLAMERANEIDNIFTRINELEDIFQISRVDQTLNRIIDGLRRNSVNDADCKIYIPLIEKIKDSIIKILEYDPIIKSSVENALNEIVISSININAKQIILFWNENLILLWIQTLAALTKKYIPNLMVGNEALAEIFKDISSRINSDKDLAIKYLEFIKNGGSIEEFRKTYLDFKEDIDLTRELFRIIQRGDTKYFFKLLTEKYEEIIKLKLHNKFFVQYISGVKQEFNLFRFYYQILYILSAENTNEHKDLFKKLLNEPTIEVKTLEVILEDFLKFKGKVIGNPLTQEYLAQDKDQFNRLEYLENTIILALAKKRMFEAIKADSLDLVKKYIKDVLQLNGDFLDSRGQNPLHYAIRYSNDIELMKTLYSIFPDFIYRPDDYGEIPLDLTSGFKGNNVIGFLAELILNLGEDNSKKAKEKIAL